MCTHLQSSIVKDSFSYLMTLVFLSLTHKDVLTITYCNPASLLPYWLYYNTLYDANDKY